MHGVVDLADGIGGFPSHHVPIAHHGATSHRQLHEKRHLLPPVGRVVPYEYEQVEPILEQRPLERGVGLQEIAEVGMQVVDRPERVLLVPQGFAELGVVGLAV